MNILPSKIYDTIGPNRPAIADYSYYTNSEFFATGSPATTAGALSDAYNFNGTNQKVSVANSSRFMNGRFTVCCWFKPEPGVPNCTIFDTAGGGVSPHGYTFLIASKKFGIVFYDVLGSLISYYSSVVLQEGVWYFVAAALDDHYFDFTNGGVTILTYNSVTKEETFYFDGPPTYESQKSPTQPYFQLAYRNSNTTYYRMNVSGLKVFNRRLKRPEMKRLMMDRRLVA